MTGAILAWLMPALTLAISPAEANAQADAEAEAKRRTAEEVFRTEVTPFLKTYCVECHGQQRAKGNISFTAMMRQPAAGERRRAWQRALAQVQAGEMPPADAAEQPTAAERKAFIDWVGTVKFMNLPDPGVFVIRRLTKVEYGNTLADLFGVDRSVAATLPDDVAGEGFLNSISPLQSEQYLAIANNVLEQALGPAEGPTTPDQSALGRKLFGESPAGGDQRRAAAKVARDLARRVFRRPPHDEEIETLLKVFDLARADKQSYAASLRLMLKAMLVSPQFLFIMPTESVAPGNAATVLPLDDHQLASRLSYFLWSTTPDAELASLADDGKLHEPEVLRGQVKRMLGDPRARALFDGFGAQWLGLDGLGDQPFDAAKFPQMTPAARAAMIDEARLFFESIVRENRAVVSFVNGDYTFLNETLASFYGLEHSVEGPEMRRVELADRNRGGILAMPGVLAVTSQPERTSPVKRGVWVLEQVLGQHVPPAPNNVPSLERQDRKKIAGLTLRQRTELHRTKAECANCHKTLDPIGFGLENFDAIGRWRDRDDSGAPIDAVGELPGGKRFTSPRELKDIVAARQDELARNLAEKLLAYTLCRPVNGYDEVVVDRIVTSIARDGYRMQSLITEIVTSYPFLNRRIPAATKTNAK